MSNWLVALTGSIYLYVALEQWFKGNSWVALMFFGYALSNVGIYYQVR